LPNTNELPIVTDVPEKEVDRSGPLLAPAQVRLTIDLAGEWSHHCLGTSTHTSVGQEIERLRCEGWSLWGIFMEGMHYLSRIDKNYLLISHSDVMDRGAERGHQDRSIELVRQGITPTQIYQTGIAKLAGPPATKEQLALIKLLAAGTTNDDIYLAGLRALAPDLPPGPEPEFTPDPELDTLWCDEPAKLPE
jgi:hypothetical protein